MSAEKDTGTGPIEGHVIQFEDGRFVFVGHRENSDDAYIQMFNPKREEKDRYTSFRLSEEAGCALARLLTGKFDGALGMRLNVVKEDDARIWTADYRDDNGEWTFSHGSVNLESADDPSGS